MSFLPRRRACGHRRAHGRARFGPLARVVAPLPAGALPRRLAQLYLGLVLYGLSDSLLVLGALGLDPWDVLQQGLSRHTGIAIGTWAILVGIAVLALWIPLRQRPGVGTLSNVIVIGVVMDITLALVPIPQSTALRVLAMVAGVVLNGIATGCYIGAGLGPGPRDGLMVGLAARGHSLRVVRTGIELAVLVAGWLLGGTVGIGTLVYAVSIGPLAHVFIPLFTVRNSDQTQRQRGRGEPIEPAHQPPAGADGGTAGERHRDPKGVEKVTAAAPAER